MLKNIIQIIFLSLGFAATAASVSAGGPRVIEITPDNIDLTDAGSLKFPIDFGKLNITNAGAQTINVKVWFDPLGRSVQCEPTSGDAANAAALCAQALSSARLSFVPGFSEPMRRGFVVISVKATPHRNYMLDLVHPIDFSGGNGAVGMMVVLFAPQANGVSQRCSVASGFLPSKEQTKLSELGKREICAAFLDRTSKGTQPCTAVPSPPSLSTKSYTCYIAARPGAFTTSITRHAEEVPVYVQADLRYPADEFAPADHLNPQDGKLQMGIGPADYPPMMLRMGLSGSVQTLLGVRSDGSVATCRPLVSSGTASLDNATCSRLVQRAHYDFKASPKYQGLRYTKSSVTWSLP